MITCDAVIVGGGPAGSSCARALTRGGLHVVLLDRATFPRDKTCAGWITPPVLETLGIDADAYRGRGAGGRTLQPIRAFRTSRLGDADVLTRFDRIVSYGIRRCEFDHFLLRRSGADVQAGEGLTSLRRDAAGERWIANERFVAPIVIGAGGHFCPVARQVGGASLGDEPIVAAQEIEVTLTPEQARACTIDAETPELFLTRDLKGYGWCFRKGRMLNVGLGRQDRHDLARHVRDFVATLMAAGKVPPDLAWRWKGHAYLIHGTSRRQLIDDGMLLIGDAAGLAYPRSGEGIRPAIESGLLAAQTILEARGACDRASLEPYRARVLARFGTGETPGAWSALPESFTTSIAARLLAMPWFAREVFLTRWFLHATDRALVATAWSKIA
jgi:geranylgeranyl reductase family protein